MDNTNEKLISSKGLILSIRDDLDIKGRTFASVKRHIDNAPAVDAVEVVHSRWVQKEFWTDGGTWRCSECGRQIMFMKGTPITKEINYCPNCGAKMDGDGNG